MYWYIRSEVLLTCPSHQNSQVNSFVASLNDPTMMAVLHTCYGPPLTNRTLLLVDSFELGVGALLSPLVATQFSTARNWSFHYISLFGLSVSTAVALIVVFRFRAQNGRFGFYIRSETT